MDCAAAALAVSQAWGDKAGEGHAINVQAFIHWAQGNLDAAEPLFLSARACALTAGDRALAAMTSANLGVIANIRGDLPEALHHYSVGLEHYRALERLPDVCCALNNMGRLHTDLRRWPEAERAYAEAVAISDTIGDRSARILLEVNRAEMWRARGERERAAEAVAQALALSNETGDSSRRAEISKLQGVLSRDAGFAVEAEAHFAEATRLAEARQDMLVLAETLRERAELCRGQGRNREALQNLNRAHRLFTQLRAKRELANTDQSVTRLEKDFVDVVKRWGESIEAKDLYTQGHCVRVADLACAIAATCGFDEQSLFWFRIGALLHDVGKLVVPSEVLNKPGKLNDDEWTLMRSHPTAGVDMLAGIDFPWDIRPIIESHHERWDGRGYPHGLRGDAIPLSARILAVADVYDALTSLRSYKAALSHERAVEIMRGDVGTAFDPDIFARFETITRNGPPQLASDAPRPMADAAVTKLTLEIPATDEVTGLPGRESLERIAAQALFDRAAAGGSVALLVIEFELSPMFAQTANEGEERRIVRRVARRLRHEMRVSDFVARTDERQFMALLPGTPPDDAHGILLRVQLAVMETLHRRHAIGDRGAPSVRLAVVTAPEDGTTVDELFASGARAIAGDIEALVRRLA
jgi:putative nucleotidyltransferase with HDIG domain